MNVFLVFKITVRNFPRLQRFSLLGSAEQLVCTKVHVVKLLSRSCEQDWLTLKTKYLWLSSASVVMRFFPFEAYVPSILPSP